MKSIYSFKKGDEIVRVQPGKPYSPKRIGPFGEEGGVRDRSYIGEKLVFVGIANGMIYCQRTSESSKKLFGDKLLELTLDIFDEGWEIYFDPQKLLEGIQPEITTNEIEQQIKNAIDNEDYELAEKLRQNWKNNHSSNM